MSTKETRKPNSGGLPLLSACRSGWEAAAFAATFSFRTVFCIERNGGPITYLMCVVILATLPWWMGLAFVAEALFTLDDAWGR